MTVHQIQFDAAGNLMPDADVNVQLEAPSRGVAGAAILDVNKHNRLMQETSEHMRDPGKMERLSELHEVNAARFENLDLIIENLIDAGQPVPISMKKERAQLRIQLTMSSAQLDGEASDE